MAFQQGSAQTVHIGTLDGAEPTAPTNPVVTVSLDNGATFEAPDNAATTRAYGVSLVLSSAETARDLVVVKVASDNCDTALREVYFEADWTAAKAGNLDAAVSSRSTLTAQQVWEYGTRTLSSYGTLVADAAAAVWAYVTRTLTSGGSGLTAQQTRDAMKLAPSAGAAAAGSIDAKLDTAQALAWSVNGLSIVNGELEVIAPRGDTYSLRVEVTDSDGDAVDLSGYTAFKFTVKAPEHRGDATDANKLFQSDGTLSGAGNNVLTFALDVADTEAGNCDTWYDCDVEVSTPLRTAVYTPLRGHYKSTFDVTRGS